MADADSTNRSAGIAPAELAELLHGRLVSPGAGTVRITDVAFDSRAPMQRGTLFAAVRGERVDGHDFVAAAVDAGAGAVLVDHVIPGLDVPQLVVPEVRAAMGPAAQAAHGWPGTRLALVGVTGTNGKTTFVSLLAQLLNRLDVRAEPVGTLTGERTTPEGPELAKHLREAADTGIEAVAMEVSSHALALHRVDGLVFDVAVFTNLGRDHLDFHASQEAYFAAKARLFEPGRTRHALVNVDDVHGRLLRDAAGELPVTEYSPADLDDVRLSARGSTFVWRGREVAVGLPGRVNLLNVLATLETAVLLGHSEDDVARAAAGLTGPPGRFQVVDLGPDASDAPTVIVDYAHSPDALAGVLDSARELLGDDERLTVVFGCGGDRDRDKRAEMGRAAALRADRVIITSDNPRGEDPLAIMEAAAQGSTAVETVVPELIVDRREAISAALADPDACSMILIAGKGHERTQTFADRVEDFDDVEVAAAEWARLRGVGDDR
ncbi:MAG: UDP-N-acetylmuramoyl-L-alanyl-D-glutamate--2,6-diaminopimelate ligase [Microthrixaceae bacterium]|nr:UDP-N-acetylmuramoyl-L-alanyl-D-glutamate--2,6-diaminopimelate ligase [Microthrixaceae bacterium]